MPAFAAGAALRPGAGAGYNEAERQRTNVTRTEETRSPKQGALKDVLLPALFALLLIAALVVTIFFTEFDWRWVIFLGGILFAAILSLFSATWKGQERKAEAAHFEQRLSAEIEQHRGTREQLERALALQQQDRMRLNKEIAARQADADARQAAEGMLALLAQNLDAIALCVDRDQRCQFHTARFAAWIGLPSSQIAGVALERLLCKRDAESLRPKLLDALDGRAGRADLPLSPRAGTEQRTLVNCLPQRNAAGQISGALLLLSPVQEGADAAPAAPLLSGDDELIAEEPAHASTDFIVADESGNAVYLSSLTEELSGWSNPRERIRQAIEHNGFDLFAQDIVALRAEASPRLMNELLIRMHDEEQNLVPPGTFLPIAERFGMMPDIDRYVVRKVLAARAAAGAAAPVACINLARSSIEDPGFPEFVARTLKESGVPGEALCFEIADNDAIACLAHASRLAYALKPLGCRFSLDGFGRLGVGFDHIKAIPLDFIKIDGSIILQILRVPEALAKVRAIQRVCRVVGIRTVAEMVESDESREKLRSVDVDYVQGFGIATPRPFS